MLSKWEKYYENNILYNILNLYIYNDYVCLVD